MPTTIIKLDSKIFDTAALKQALSAIPYKRAKEFQNSTRRRMIEQSPAGKLYEKKKSGRGFKRSHRASARGQRPQPDTLTLSNAVEANRTGEFSALVDIANKINPENGENARDYAERLVNNLDRPIFTKDDIRIEQTIQNYEVNKVIQKFI